MLGERETVSTGDKTASSDGSDSKRFYSPQVSRVIGVFTPVN